MYCQSNKYIYCPAKIRYKTCVFLKSLQFLISPQHEVCSPSPPCRCIHLYSWGLYCCSRCIVEQTRWWCVATIWCWNVQEVLWRYGFFMQAALPRNQESKPRVVHLQEGLPKSKIKNLFSRMLYTSSKERINIHHQTNNNIISNLLIQPIVLK